MATKPTFDGISPLVAVVGVGAVPLFATFLGGLSGPSRSATGVFLVGADILFSLAVLLLSLWWFPRSGGAVRKLWFIINVALLLTLLVQLSQYLYEAGVLRTTLARDVYRFINSMCIVVIILRIKQLTQASAR